MVLVRVAAGVPLITQVEALITSPAGSAGVDWQLVIAEPLLASTVGVTVIVTLSGTVVPLAPT